MELTAELISGRWSRAKPSALYLVGEMLDRDDHIGVNFQWAWATGYLASRGVRSLGKIGSSGLAGDGPLHP
jgi:predicted flavoprotein YhiN